MYFVNSSFSFLQTAFCEAFYFKKTCREWLFALWKVYLRETAFKMLLQYFSVQKLFFKRTEIRLLLNSIPWLAVILGFIPVVNNL